MDEKQRILIVEDDGAIADLEKKMEKRVYSARFLQSMTF